MSGWQRILYTSLAAAIGALVYANEAVAAGSDARVALVIGNATYPSDSDRLAQPIKDARAIAVELRRDGFEVIVGEDLSKQRLRAAFDNFKSKIKPGSTALFFFSGYGIQSGKRSYIIPIDAQIWAEGDVSRDGIGIESIVAELNDAGATVKLVIIDAARRNPFERRFRAVPAGLASLNAPAGTLAIYSAATDKVANDSGGENSLFVTELLESLQSRSATAVQVFNNTLIDVSRASNSAQVPYMVSTLTADFYFDPRQSVVAGVSPVVPLASGDTAECDRWAASPQDTTRPVGVAGVDPGQIEADRAVPACRSALEGRPNDLRLMFQLARALEKAGGADSDTEAARLYRRAADGGFVVAMNNLAAMYNNGRGVARDSTEAANWFRKAADAGLPLAMRNVAEMYEKGRGVARDEVQAAQWYRRAADAGEPYAMNTLGVLYANGRGVNRDDAEAIRWYRKAADAGLPIGMNNLGVFYKNGRGVAKDEAEALRWFGRAAEAGNGLAMNNLGLMYANGTGVAKDDAEALRWYRRAADTGAPLGMVNLGLVYETGKGVAPDQVEAIRWYRKAAESGLPLGMYHLGLMYANGRGADKDEAEAVRWFTRAAEAGLPVAMNDLGLMYENGRGVSKDLAEATRWYHKAADAGSDAAKTNLQRLQR